MDNGESYSAEPVPLCSFKLKQKLYSYGIKIQLKV